MGCQHYEAAAAAAKAKIAELKKERAKYLKARSSVKEAARAIGCYTDFLSSLDKAMGDVIVNGEPFDKNESSVHYTNLKDGAQTLEKLQTEMTNALTQIATDITGQQDIIDNEYDCCSTDEEETTS